jgi:hypothetical protein
MLSLAAVVVSAGGVNAASFADLAASSGAIPMVMVKSGTDAAALLNNRRVIEALQLQSSILLLFENATEAEAFEHAAGLARAAAGRAKAAALTARGRRFARTRA